VFEESIIMLLIACYKK